MIWTRNLVWSSHTLVRGGRETLKIVTIEIQHCCSDSWLLSRPVTDSEDDCDWIVFILESKTLGLLKGLIEEFETLLYPCNVWWLSWPSSHSPAPAKGGWCVDTDGFCPFRWSCEFAWATHPSAGLLSWAAPGVPGRPRCQKRSEKDPRLSCRFEIPWGARRVSREQSSHEQTCSILCSLSVLGTATALARQAKALPAGESQDSPRAQKAPAEAAAKGEFTALEEPKNTAQTDHSWMHIFHQRRLFGQKMPPSPFHQFLCAAGIQLLRLDLINAQMGRFVWSRRWYYGIGLSNLSVSSPTIFMNI